MNYGKLILTEQHFRSNGNDFTRDARFTIMEIIEKDINIKQIIEKTRRQMDKLAEKLIRHLDLI